MAHSKEWYRKWKPPHKLVHGKLTRWNWLVFFPQNLKISKYVDIGAFSLLNARYGIELGENVQLGGGVKIYSVNTIDGTKGRVIIKRNVKIGANSVILQGVTIGENSVIGALSLVNRSIPPNVVACGVPARIIKQ